MSARASQIETATVVDATADGRGIARTDGKTVFVHGAIAGERVRFVRRRKRRSYDEAELVEVLAPSADRVSPECRAFGICGGCSLQHLAAAAQLELKQRVLLDSLARIGDVEPAEVLPAISGDAWGYRRKARLAAKYVAGKGRVLVGFRERHTSYVADMERCETLHPRVGGALNQLSQLIGGLSIKERLPQIEVAVGDNAASLVFRLLTLPSAEDLEKFRGFSNSANLQIFLQPAGPRSVEPLRGGGDPAQLFYEIPAHALRIYFEPLDFIQVHREVNLAMIDQAMTLLDIHADSRVLDLFCGLGNLTLPLARKAREVVGVEESAEMISRAERNASRAGIDNVSFRQGDLSEPRVTQELGGEAYDRVLLDPPRTGAREVIEALGRTGAGRIVYISCHPGTLARDAAKLVNEMGYDLSAAGLIDMFPQTSHVESMAVFEKR